MSISTEQELKVGDIVKITKEHAGLKVDDCLIRVSDINGRHHHGHYLEPHRLFGHTMIHFDRRRVEKVEESEPEWE